MAKAHFSVYAGAAKKKDTKSELLLCLNLFALKILQNV
jgi:hypothetical protein